jgi:hypothetical protein
MALIRFRRFIAGICLVLAAILTVFAGTGIWLERNVLNTNNFTLTADEVIRDSAVQKAIAEQVVDQIVGNDKKLEIARPFLEPIVQQVVASAPFQKVFDEAVRNSHQVLTNEKAKQLVLNISNVVDDVKSVLNEVAPGLAAQIPDGKKVEVTILEKSKLGVVWDTIDLIRKIVVALIVSFFVLAVLGFLIAPYRWRSMALFGATAAIAGIVWFLIFTGGRMATASIVSSDDVIQTAIRQAWNIVFSNLMWMSVIVAIIGALLFVIGRFIDRSGGWGTSWKLMRTAWSRIGRTAATVSASAASATRSAVARAEDRGRAQGEPEAITNAAELPTAPEPVAVPDVAATETVHALHAGRRMWGALRPAYRAVILLAVGILALFQPGGVADLLITVIGIALLWFAFLEAVAAWRSNRPEEPAANAES